MAQDDHKDAVARAWQLHRDGRQNDAINGFEAVLKAAPDHLDAEYGLGLAQRSAGMKEAALESFQRSAKLIARALEAEPQASRYQMLHRMVHQRISELTTGAQSK
jgi:tetratricopeptide (TPR) repeat protein